MKIRALLPLCILAAQPLLGLTNRPILEFEAGAVEKFSTGGHPKAKGVVFTMDYPKSWKATDGDTPDIVQKLVSNNGKGLEQILIITKVLPAEMKITSQKIEELLSPAELKKSLPENATLIRTHGSKVANGPAAILEYWVGKAGSATDVHVVSCFFVQGHTLVQIQFRIVGSPPYPSEDRTQVFSPLWDAMISSITFPDKTKTAADH